jgi:hypothetical protein
MNARAVLSPQIVKIRASLDAMAQLRDAPRDRTRPGLYTRPGVTDDLDRAARRQVEHEAQQTAALWRRHPAFDDRGGHPGFEHGGGSRG